VTTISVRLFSLSPRKTILCTRSMPPPVEFDKSRLIYWPLLVCYYWCYK
jgi:hypothetical protein